MPKYMLIYKLYLEEDPDAIGTAFKEKWCDADSMRMDIECGMGGWCSIYEYMPVEDFPDIYEYQCIMM